jgi:hypothetical protein
MGMLNAACCMLRFWFVEKAPEEMTACVAITMLQVQDQLFQTQQWDASYKFLKAVDDKLHEDEAAWDRIANTRLHLDAL